jgi:hypothetical protein
MNEVLSLENFRNEMDEKVLERGWFYFSKGWVLAHKEVLPGFYESVIHEVVPHAVSYSLSEADEVNDVFCTCGELWCRHLAAVLFTLEAERRPPDVESEHVI